MKNKDNIEMIGNHLKFKIILITILILWILSCSSSSEPKYDFISVSKIDITDHGHSTTRQFQRKVFFVNGQWYVFYSNGKDCRYKVSEDGLTWSDPVIMDKDIAGSSNMTVIYNNNTFYYFNSLKDSINPKTYRVLHGRKGIIYGKGITWEKPIRIFIDIGLDECIHYSSVAMDQDGFFWAASRHFVLPDRIQDVIVTRSIEPLNIESWKPRTLGLKNKDSKSIGPQIVGLGNGSALLVGKASDKMKFFGNYYNGTNWLENDFIIAESSEVWGDDRRMSMVVESSIKDNRKIVHLVYIDDKSYLRYRTFSAPYNEQSWRPQLDEPGTILVKDENGNPIKTYTCILSIDRTKQPAWLYLLYGETKIQGKDKRAIMGELRLLRFKENLWSSRSLLMSEEGAEYNWFPNMNEEVDKKLGILYQKNKKADWDIVFTSADKAAIDAFFDAEINAAVQ